MERTHLVAFMVVSATALAACGGGRRGEAKRPPVPAVHQVKVGIVAQTGTDAAVPVPGVVAARERATLSARITATVLGLPFREGDRITKGAVVVRLDDAAVRSAERAAEVAAKTEEADLARSQALLSKGAATLRERDEALARAEAARAVLSGARDQLAYVVLRAPFQGVVASVPIHVGDVVSPGTPLLEVEGEGGFEVRATVPAVLAALVAPGQVIACDVDGQMAPRSAVVRSVAPAADPSTHRVELRADLASTAGLRSGLFARIAIPRQGSVARLTVPSEAIVARGGLTGVFVVSGDRALLRWVALGASGKANTEVRAGLEVGERVVLDPGRIIDGARVEVVP